jgi:hypothetical protein
MGAGLKAQVVQNEARWMAGVVIAVLQDLQGNQVIGLLIQSFGPHADELVGRQATARAVGQRSSG